MALNNIGLGFIIRAKDMASAAFASAGKSLSELQKRATGAGADVEQVGDLLSGTGKKMMAVGAAGFAGLGLAASSATDFGKSVAEVASIADKAEFPMDRIKSIGMGMASTYGGDLNKQVKTLYQAISSGASTSADATSLMHEANKLAIGGLSDSFLAIDATTNVLNAYGMKMTDAAQVSDAMFVTVNKGKTTIDELANVIGRVAPTAAAMGVSMDDMFSAVTAASTRLGNASESVTGFKAALANIQAPTKDAADEAKRLGIQFDGAALRSKGLARFMQDITSSGQYNADTMGKLFGSIEAFNFVSAIAANNGVALSDSMSAMSKKAGAADAAFQVVNATGAQTADRVKAKFQVAMTRLGEAILPVVEKITVLVEKLLDAFNNAPSFVQTGIAAFIAVGSVLLFVLGAALAVVGALVGLEAAGVTVASVSGAFAAAGPVIAIVAGVIAAVIATFEAFKIAYDKNIAGFGYMMNIETGRAGLGWTALTELIENGGFSEATAKELQKTENAGIGQFVVNMREAFSTFAGLWDIFTQGFSDAVEAMEPLWIAITGMLATAFEALGQTLDSVAESFGGANGEASGFQMIVAGLGATVGVTATILATAISAIVGVFAMILPPIIGVVRAIFSILGSLVDVVIHVGMLLGAIFSGDWAAAWDILKKIVLDVVMGVIDAVALMVEGIARSIDAVMNAASPGSGKLAASIKGAREDMRKDLEDLMGTKSEKVSAEIVSSSFNQKKRTQGGTGAELNRLLDEAMLPKMPAPTPGTAPAAAGAQDMQALLAQLNAIQPGKGGAAPVDVNLKSILVVDGSEMASVIQKYQVDTGQRGLAPTPLPQ